MTGIKEKAEYHCKSFAAAMTLRDFNPSATTTDIAEAMWDHYLQSGFISFTLGTKQEAGTRYQVVPFMAKYFDMWIDRGLGLDIRMESYRVFPFSSSAAMCLMTWRYHPPSNSKHETRAWQSLYAFRLVSGQDKGYWEFCVKDNKTWSILQRFPDFVDPLKQ